MSYMKRRGGHRSAATKLIKDIEALMEQTAPNQSKVSALIQNLKTQQGIILEFDAKIQESMDDEDEVCEDIMESLEIAVMMDKCLFEAGNHTNVGLKTASNNHQCNHGGSIQNVKLPHLQLPQFSGNPMEWPEFWDCFEASVDSRSDMSDTHKFAYLKGQMKKGASELLSGFSVTNVNYREAVALLKETYGKPDKIIVSHLHAILDLDSPTFSNSGLSRFRSQYECHLRALGKLKPEIKNSGFVLATILMRKLPPKVRDNMNRSANLCLWELDEFKKRFNSEIEFLQASEEEEYQDEKSDKTNYVHKTTVSNFNTTVTKKRESKYSKACKYCNAEHYSSNCIKYPTIEKRLKRIEEQNLCRNCLGNHSPTPCWSRYKCFKCGEKHHSSICRAETNTNLISNANEVSELDSSPIVAATQQVRNQSIALPTAILNIKTSIGTFKLRALFDQCAQRSMMIGKVARMIGLVANRQMSLCIDGFGSQGKYKEYDCIKIDIGLPSRTVAVEVILVESLPSRISVPGLHEIINQLESKGVNLADPFVDEDRFDDISILIGADYYYKFISGQQMVNGINLLKSDFGNLITGPVSSTFSDKSTNEVLTVMHVADVNEENIEDCFQRLWSLEAIAMDDVTKNVNDEEAMKLFNENIKYEKGKYIAKLPWKPNHAKLQLNYKMARGMLVSTLEKLRNNPKQLEIYDGIIKDQLERGFIERVDQQMNENIGERLHYLTHHGVKKNSITTPLRIVFNCSAGNPSLNDCLYRGPSMVPEISQILLRFRLHKYACTSDIAKAFLMIALDEEDRDATRFLWPIEPSKKNSVLQTFRFRVILFGATCSQFILNATVDHHLSKINNNVSSNIKRNMYVDNLVSGFETEEEITKFYIDSKAILDGANLHLREWSTNSLQLKDLIDQNHDGCSELPPVSVLGLKWDPKSDELRLLIEPFEKKEDFTKRIVLSQASKLFDPLGMWIPVLIRAKIFLQTLWMAKVSWDEILDKEKQDNWMKIANDIQMVNAFTFPRQAIIGNEVVLHAFSDASSKAYCAAVYFVHAGLTRLVMAKARVAPIRELTIPQLELAAATLSARLVKHVTFAYERELKINGIHMWVDSQIVLHWIEKTKDTKAPFIKNRVHEIRELVPNAIWHYVTTKENPSDLATRGIDAKVLMTSGLWFEGPTWLKDSAKWPQINLTSNNAPDSEAMPFCNILSAYNSTKDELIINYERFGTFNRLLRTVALVFRFYYKVKCKRTSSTDKDFLSHNIDGDELRNAEKNIIEMVQKQEFLKEVEFFKSKTSKSSPTNLIKQLNLFFEDGIIRCHGRIKHSTLDYDTRFPILIPNNHHITTLLIRKFHEERFHVGVNDTLTCMRQRYWMPHMRQRIKTFRRLCVVCLKLNGVTYRIPPCPQLPSMRVTDAHPFQICGIDYTGAMHVKDGGTWNKTYVCLFTCAVSRAIHLELVPDNSTEAFLFALRRFIGRRGIPQSILTDNSTTFISAAENLKRLYNHPSVKNFVADRKISWKFIPKRAPWFGGYWERMISLTKTALKKSIGRNSISSDELRTLLVEIESILNDRPLTYASSDVEDSPAITPSQLMYGRRLDTSINYPIQELDEDYESDEMLNKRQKRCARIIQAFWLRWRSEYLTSLRETQHRNSGSNSVAVGDLVHIHDECSRINWRMGVIESLIQGKDGHVRSVTLRTSTGKTSRPIAKLYPLEIRAISNSNHINDNKLNIDTESQDDVIRFGPKRKAAEEALRRMKILADDEEY